ncbi:NAD(P)-dependent oxidoreductase, partial [Staphylococcus aureus]
MVALPLTAQTHHFVDRGFISQLKPHACLVNVGRGSVVAEEVVADALQQNLLGGYAADVFELEDWACPGHPDHIDPRLLS